MKVKLKARTCGCLTDINKAHYARHVGDVITNQLKVSQEGPVKKPVKFSVESVLSSLKAQFRHEEEALRQTAAPDAQHPDHLDTTHAVTEHVRIENRLSTIRQEINTQADKRQTPEGGS